MRNSAPGRRRILLSALLSLALSGGVAGLVPASAQDPATSPTPDPGRILERVRTLTAPALAGRGAGTPEVRAAGELLASWLAEKGLEPAFDGAWFQNFPLTGQGWTGEPLVGKEGRNVAGVLPGTGTLADRYVLVGAHYDHLGRVDPTRNPGSPPAAGEYYPGANDNASGLAVLFELLATVAADTQQDEDRRSLVFACFAAEEVGLQGSGYLASHLPVPPEKIDAMINFDTVGRMTDRRLHVSGVGTAACFRQMATAANTAGLELSLARGGWSGSDHMSFNTKEIPVLYVFAGPYLEYNTPADSCAAVSATDMTEIASYSTRLVDLVRRHAEPIPWIMVAGKDLRQGTGEGANRDTWFGSLPDFTEDAGGYALAGVFDDSPAARAGLRKGDVLTGLGGRDVADLASFTTALRAHAPGDLVEVTVLRDGRSLNFTVVLGNRSDRK